MKQCINCEHFAYWDGDWCCCAKFLILSGIDEKKGTLNPENCEKDMSDCEDYVDDFLDATPERIRYRKEEWEYWKNKGKISED